MEHKPEHHQGRHITVEEEKTGEVKEEKNTGRSILITAIIIIVIVAILALIIISTKYLKNNNTVTYNNYVFEKYETNKWMTQQLIKGQLYNIPFYNNPTQVLDIPIDPNSISVIRDFSFNTNGTVYVAVDPNESSKIVMAGIEYARLLGTVYNIYNMNVSSAISRSVPGKPVESPVKTCDDASTNTLVIYQFVSDKNLVSIEGNCILLESKDINESIRVADAFAFRLLNIIQE